MEHRKRPEYVLEVLADPTCVKDIVRGILHTIFFHRYFPSMRPSSLEVLDLTLPVVADPELETLIETRVGQLVRQLSSTSSPSGGSRGELGVRFFEKRRRKASGLGGWLTGTGRSEEEICWEVWKLKITLTTPRTETGKACPPSDTGQYADLLRERMTLLRAEAPALQKTAMTIVKIVNRDKDHIPPITTSETNPFPYEILLNPRAEYDGKSIGFFS
ncbi:MAG: hypothetical protein Q9211_000119 [Gyalolechia sp. 1 TL-2023]